MRHKYQRWSLQQCHTSPSDAALAYVSEKFPNSEEVLEAAIQMMAVQIGREPLFRRCVREAFDERARIDVNLTEKGSDEIDENHPLRAFIKDMHAHDLIQDQYLRLVNGEKENLITVVFTIDGANNGSYADEVKALFQQKDSSEIGQEWNNLCNQAVDVALNNEIPDIVEELKSKSMNKAQEFVRNFCCDELCELIQVKFLSIQIISCNFMFFLSSSGLQAS